jgi:hypothetical protein
MSQKKDITHLLERLEAFEDRFDLRLNAMSAFMDEFNEVVVYGELHPREGMQLKQPVALSVDGYDAAGRIVGGTCSHFKPDQVYGYFSFEAKFVTPVVELAKIRIFPMPWNPKPWE